MERSRSGLAKNDAEKEKLKNEYEKKLTKIHENIDVSYAGDVNQFQDVEMSTRWPLNTYFILLVEFCERFCYYGLRSVLAMFLKKFLALGEETSTTFYHVYGLLCYIFPVIGAIVSDSYWGRFNTIWRFCLIYLVGCLLLTAASVPTFFMTVDNADRSTHMYLAFGGLFLIAAGSGGIKPCVAPFGADQFNRYATKAKESYFKWFYMLINIGGLISAFITPWFREAIDCYPSVNVGQEENKPNLTNPNLMMRAFDQCHIMSYGVPTILMFVTIISFLTPDIRSKMNRNATGYVKEEPKSGENVVFMFVRVLALRKYNTPYELGCCKQVLKVGLLFSPVIVFWAIFEQVGSIWTFQAEQMSGKVGSFYFVADQIEVVNSLLVIMLIPAWHYFVMPLINKFIYSKSDTEFQKKRPVHMMNLGLLITCGAAFLAWNLQNSIDTSLAINSDKLTVGVDNPTIFIFNSDDNLGELVSDSAPKPGKYFSYDPSYSMCFESKKNDTRSIKKKCFAPADILVEDAETKKVEKKVNFFYIADGTVKLAKFPNKLSSQKQMLIHDSSNGKLDALSEEALRKRYNESSTACKTLAGAACDLYKDGATRIVVNGNMVEVLNGRDMNVISILPQYFALTLGEILVSVTALEFAYTQAPSNMKTICTALWYCTVAFANLYVMMISVFTKGKTKSLKMMVSLVSVIAATIIFYFIGRNYRVLEQDDITTLEGTVMSPDEQPENPTMLQVSDATTKKPQKYQDSSREPLQPNGPS